MVAGFKTFYIILHTYNIKICDLYRYIKIDVIKYIRKKSTWYNNKEQIISFFWRKKSDSCMYLSTFLICLENLPYRST
jgi:hypothetical protein